jgi:hypothetical protein
VGGGQFPKMDRKYWVNGTVDLHYKKWLNVFVIYLGNFLSIASYAKRTKIFRMEKSYLPTLKVD